MSFKKFETTLGSEYGHSFPKKLPLLQSFEGNPCFIDSKMQLFDKNYKLITKKEKPLVDGKGPFSFEEYAPGAVFPEFKDLKFTNYIEITTIQDYEAYISTWLEKVHKFLYAILPPYCVISKNYVPTRAPLINQKTPFFRKYDQIKNPLPPRNMLALHTFLLNPEMPNFEQQFSLQIPRREVAKLKHHMTPDPQWQTQCVPSEPIPQLYSEFSDFEESYKRWYVLANDSFTVQPPMEPLQFSKILNLNPVEPMAVEEYNIEYITYLQRDQLKEMNKKKSEIDYSWVNDCPNLNGKEIKLPEILKDIQVQEPKHFDTIQNQLVFGVIKEEFINDFLLYGYHRPTLNATTSLHPFKHLNYYAEDNSEDKVERFISNVATETENNLFAFLKIPFKLDKTKKIVTNILSGQKTFRFYKNFFTPHNLTTLFEYAAYSDQYTIRTASILRYLTTQPLADTVASYLLEPQNLPLLFQFTKLSLCLSDENIELFKIIDDKSNFAITTQQLYLASLILRLSVCQFCLPFETVFLNFCHKESRSIAMKLAKSDLANQLWDSLKEENEMSDSTKLLFILESIHSDNILTTLLGNHILTKIIELSHYKYGRKFLFKLVFSKGGQAATFLIKDSQLFTVELCAQIDNMSSYIISLLLDEFSSFLRQRKCYAPLHNLNDFLTTIMRSYSPVYKPILLSILNIFTYPQLISPNDESYFDGIIGSFIGQVCIQSTFQTNLQLSDALMMLTPLTKIYNYSEHILLNPDFIIKVLNQMSDPSCSKKLLQQLWTIFQGIPTTQDYASRLLSINSLGNALSPIASSEDPILFMNLSDFINKLTTFGPKIMDQAESVLSSSLGRIACTIKNAPKLFALSTKTLHATNQMLSSVMAVDTSFKKNLTTHLNSLGMDLSQYTFTQKKSSAKATKV